jgi:glutamate/tyrosine decarboxylase-like PLP-dependent enzyme
MQEIKIEYLQTLINSLLNPNELRAGPVLKNFSPHELQKKFDAGLDSLGNEELSTEKFWQVIQEISDLSAKSSHPLFLNQLFGGFQNEAIVGDILISLLNTTMATYEVAPLMTLLEKEVVKNLTSLFGFKLGEGIMVTGGSNANLVGMLCARQFKIPDVKKRGYHSKLYTVYVSADAHYSYEKAMHIAGVGSDMIRKIKVNQNGEMDVAILRQQIQEDTKQGFIPLMIGATAGTTVLGAFDPLTEINQVAREYKLWLHVDAAWGGGAIFSKTHRKYLKGIHLADSITFDAHKTLSSGLITSFFLCKHPGMLKLTNQGGGSEYLFHDYDNSDWDTGSYSLQCGRRADILKMWLLWRSRSTAGLESIIDHLFALKDYAQEKLTQLPRVKIISSNYLNICFQITPPQESIDINQFTLKVRTQMIKQGHAMVNYAQMNDGRLFFRLVFANNQTQTQDIDMLMKILLENIQQVDRIY